MAKPQPHGSGDSGQEAQGLLHVRIEGGGDGTDFPGGGHTTPSTVVLRPRQGLLARRPSSKPHLLVLFHHQRFVIKSSGHSGKKSFRPAAIY